MPLWRNRKATAPRELSAKGLNQYFGKTEEHNT